MENWSVIAHGKGWREGVTIESQMDFLEVIHLFHTLIMVEMFLNIHIPVNQNKMSIFLLIIKKKHQKDIIYVLLYKENWNLRNMWLQSLIKKTKYT